MLAVKRVASNEKVRNLQDPLTNSLKRQLMGLDGEIVNLMTSFEESVM